MLKKTIKFDDLEGNEVEQTFYFSYNKKEIAELLEFGEVQKFRSGKDKLPLEEQLRILTIPMEESGLTNTENNQQAYDIFQDLLLNAFGEKGADNVTFVKNQKLRDYWESHVAFVDLVFEMLEDTVLFNEFIQKCLPPKLVEAAKKELEAEGKKVSSEQLTEMVQTAAERQADPETAITPGPGAAEIEEGRMTDGKTDAEILSAKPLELSRPQLLRAMELRNQS